jgi:integrase
MKDFTDKSIARLKVATRATMSDPLLAGHYVRATPQGGKSFVAVARSPSGQQVWHTIGSTSLYTVAESRDKARQAIKAIREGRDREDPDTFGEVANDWFSRHVEGRKLISAPDLKSHLERHLKPAWGNRDFNSIRRGDVAKLLDSIEDKAGAVVADAVLSTIRSISNWYALRHEDYVSPIVRGMRRTVPVKRDHILTDDEIREVWRVAETNGVFGAFIRVALLTAQRREKVVSMRWQDLSDDGEWLIPSTERQKNTAGSIMLPKQAIEIVRAQHRFASNPHVFAGRGANYIQGQSKRKAQFDAKLEVDIDPWTVHDLRRTARSLMSRAGVRPDIAERVLGHAIRGVEGVYDRHQYLEEKAHALRALAGLIDSILAPQDAKVRRLTN